MMQEYQWTKNATHAGVPPERAAELFREIESRNGTLTPDALVDASRPNTAPFHKAFTWDDFAAAENYRREQARRLIGGLLVVYRKPENDKPIPTRAFVSVVKMDAAPAGDHGDETVTGYLNLDTVMADDVLRAKYLRSAARELASWRRRYSDLRELSDVFTVADQVLAALT